MKLKKLTIITTDCLTIRQLADGYYELDMIHPSQQLDTLLVTLQNPKAENIVIQITNDCMISHINNIILSTEFNMDIPIYKDVKLTRNQVEVLDNVNKPCKCGKYGFEVPWMNQMLNELFEVSNIVHENVPE